MNKRSISACNILYLEDDPSSRHVMALILEKAAHVTTYAIFENSANFMERLNNLVFKPDIFLLDIHVPPHDGFQVLQMLRADAEHRAAKIIALTASVTNEEVDQLHAAGFDGAISKPVDHRQLPGLLERIANGESIWSIS
jgi:CheY-like chemotaxis protein